MARLPFSLTLIQLLADHRTPLLTSFFLFATFLGEVEGYILIITAIYVMFDKRLAVRLSILVLLTMSLNHLLKIIIKNPRPFISEGTYASQWAVSAHNAAELATEYSTPSGHAMGASAFYSYLYACVDNPYVRGIAVLTILLTGLSRPYLGVHYLEDVLAGWAIGLSCALLAIAYADRVARAWNRLSDRQRVGIAVASSLTLWLLTIAVNGWRIDGQPRAFLGYAGFLTGIVIGRPLELRRVNFDPKSSSLGAKLTRYILSVGMVIVTLLLLGKFFAMIAENFSMLGYLLQYVRYTSAGIVSIFVAPLSFTRLGLARSVPELLDDSSTPSATRASAR